MVDGLRRRDFLKVASLAVGSVAVSGCKTLASNGGAGAQKPNIIFIMADDLGYAELGCYGQKKIRTPHIDRMAREGMRFTDFYTGSAVCAPARCTLITGKHGGHAYVRDNQEVGGWETFRGQLPLPADAVAVAGGH